MLPQDGYVVYIQRYSGLWEWGEYSSFSVGPESDKYRLSVSSFSGDAGDALAGHPHPFIFANGMQFSTPDHDNDRIAGNCAASGKGSGWWHNGCSRSVLNNDPNAYWDAESELFIKNIQAARMLVKFD